MTHGMGAHPMEVAGDKPARAGTVPKKSNGLTTFFLAGLVV